MSNGSLTGGRGASAPVSQSLKDNGGLGWRTLEEPAQLVLAVAVVVACLGLPALAGNVYWLHIAQLCCLYASAAVFQNLLVSDANQISFGQGAVFGVAAYSFGMASGLNGLPLAAGAGLGICAAVLVGLVLAGPSLRVQGYYLGFVTIAACEIVEWRRILYAENNPHVRLYEDVRGGVPSLADRPTADQTVSRYDHASASVTLDFAGVTDAMATISSDD